MNSKLNPAIEQLLHAGTVIPAHPLALNKDLSLNVARQRSLTKYYIESGAGGVAVGVHTTQFEIRKPEFNLLEAVLQLAAEEIDSASLTRPFIKIAGVCGPTDQAVAEAELAVKHGYHFALLSMGGLGHLSEVDLIKRTNRIAEIIPVFGFYLQPAVGGRVLSYDFWRAFAEIQNVHAIKVAAFNRYQTLDVLRAVCDSSRRDKIALYTGNDDNIIADLLTPYRFEVDGVEAEKRFVGGLLGHWAVWTSKAVELFNEIRQLKAGNGGSLEDMLAKGIAVTDMNAAIFDVKYAFKGCIAGIHEVLRRQGLLEGTWCLSPNEVLSPGQSQEIDRVYKMYPSLTDDEFVKQFVNSI